MVTGFILDLLLLKLQLNPAIFKRSICKNGLLTKCEVKMAGYWPSYLFARLWTETESIKSQKIRPISNHLDRTSLANECLLYGFRGNFSCGMLQLARPGSRQSQRRNRFILPAQGASHITNTFNASVFG